MANTPAQIRKNPAKLVVLALLTPLCIWLVYRNLLHPAGVSPAERPPAAAQAEISRPGEAAGGAAGLHSGTHDPSPAASEDPTLRLDLLRAARSVEYRGSSRNIFQAYVPPPPAAPAPALHPGPGSAAAAHSGAPQAPATPSIPLKFYGTAQSPGNPRQKAFLTDAEGNIYIAQEGDVVAKFYRLDHIGVNSAEVEDTRTHLRQQLPLAEN